MFTGRLGAKIVQFSGKNLQLNELLRLLKLPLILREDLACILLGTSISFAPPQPPNL